MTSGNHKNSIPETIVIKNNYVQLESVKNTKYLGITYSSNFKWNLHNIHIMNDIIKN